MQQLLDKFWENHDPTQKHKTQYMSAIFYHNEEQMKVAENSMKEQQKKYSRPIATVIKPVGTFYDAEDYHQKYQLRQHASLFKSLNLKGKALLKSHVAAKLNTYVSGYVPAEQIEKEAKELGLTDAQKNEIIKIIKAGVTRHC
ncbi:peptide methionine sulfoxide reductase-like protein [Leptotrombidium deliense]|uniref:peptide-methionine (S)-S-oxide reductase n=1 Tax=Leptotrombidium deliense TaxID=299467 RepID=A0A443RT16_9ACAR|nr:peptide methionine sulfoxide reductase-like protein [Leptotrombidium deliense]